MSTSASATVTVLPVAFADGLGTISFVANSDECFGQLRVDGSLTSIRGSYGPARVMAENDNFLLSLTPIARPSASGPRLRGQLVDKRSGEIAEIVAWAPTKGGKAYGLSVENRAPTETHLPF